MPSTDLRHLSTEPRWPRWPRVLACLALTAASLPAAAYAAFVALVVWTGCFIECHEPDRDPAGGLALLLLAAALTASGPALAGWLFRSRAWWLVAGSVLLLALLGGLAVVAADA